MKADAEGAKIADGAKEADGATEAGGATREAEGGEVVVYNAGGADASVGATKENVVKLGQSKGLQLL